MFLTTNHNLRVQTVEEIVGEHRMQKFHGELEKMFYVLKQVQENNRRLTQKCRQLNDQIDTNVGSVNAVLHMTEEESLANIQTQNVNGCIGKL